MKKKMQEYDGISFDKGIVELVLELDRVQATRAAVMAVIQPAINELNKQGKGIKQSMVVALDGISATDSTKVATYFCLQIKKKGESTSKQIQRRRDTFLSVLAEKFTDYDFERDDIGRFSCSYVGCSSTREANDILSVLAKVKELHFELPAIDKAELVAAINAAKADELATQNIQVLDTTPEAGRYLSQISKASGDMAAAIQSGTSQQEEGKVSQA